MDSNSRLQMIITFDFAQATKTLIYIYMKLFGCLDYEIENKVTFVWLRFTDFSFGQFGYLLMFGLMQ